MKKVFFTGALALLGAVSVNAQSLGNFKLGAHVGVPVGGDDADSKSWDFNTGVDAAYVWKVAHNFDLGITTGYSHFIGKKVVPVPNGIESVNTSFGVIPLAATAQYNFEQKFFIGTDLGYAFYTGENTEGGDFYFQPKVGYTINMNNEVYLGYKGLSNDGETLSSINLGYAYKF